MAKYWQCRSTLQVLMGRLRSFRDGIRTDVTLSKLESRLKGTSNLTSIQDKIEQLEDECEIDLSEAKKKAAGLEKVLKEADNFVRYGQSIVIESEVLEGFEKQVPSSETPDDIESYWS